MDKLEQLVTGLAGDRDPIGNAITGWTPAPPRWTDLLTPPTAGQHRRPAGRAGADPESDQATLDIALQKAPKNYRKMVRLGSYGSWIKPGTCAACRCG